MSTSLVNLCIVTSNLKRVYNDKESFVTEYSESFYRSKKPFEKALAKCGPKLMVIIRIIADGLLPTWDKNHSGI